MLDSLKILFVASEVAPHVKTGGLGDVANALPSALRRRGHDVRIAMPCYGAVPKENRGRRVGAFAVTTGSRTRRGVLREAQLPDVGAPMYLVEYDPFFRRDHPYGCGGKEYADNLERFCFFSRAVLEGVAQTGWKPDVVHCNDWHTAGVPAFLKTDYAGHPVWDGMPTVFTIHNLGYQGRYTAALFSKTGLDSELFTPKCFEFRGEINLLKGGIACANKINTVSRTYAREIQTSAYGHGLDGFLRSRRDDLTGIVNGIDYDEWCPAHDSMIASRYSAEDISGKQRCKASIREEIGLAPSEAPLFCMVSRLVWQKGVDLLVDALDRFLDRDVQLMVLGTGEGKYEESFERASARGPRQVAYIKGYDEPLAHRFYAGADFFLMPSLTEPCGLSQMYGLTYGTIPIVRQTGGLADTVTDVTPANLSKGRATGIVFRPPTADALLRAVLRAIRLYENPDALQNVRRAGMKEDLSWERASEEYVALYREALRSA